MILDGEHADWTGLISPQASLLLFLLCVNDLPDVYIYSTDENPVVLGARIEKDLERVAKLDKNERPEDECRKNSADGSYSPKKLSIRWQTMKMGDACLEKQNCV